MNDLDKQRHVWRRRVRCDRGLSSTAAIVLTHLEAEYVNRETGLAWPGSARLAEELGFCERTIRNALSEGEARGYISVSRQRGRGRTNVYALVLEGLPAEAPKDRPRPSTSKPRPMPPGSPARENRNPRSGYSAAMGGKMVPAKPERGFQSYREPPKEPPTRRLVAIDLDSRDAERWREWLSARGSPQIKAFPRLPDGRVCVPSLAPPEPDEPIALSITEKWLAQARVTDCGTVENTRRNEVGKHYKRQITRSNPQNGPNSRKLRAMEDRIAACQFALGCAV